MPSTSRPKKRPVSSLSSPAVDPGTKKARKLEVTRRANENSAITKRNQEESPLLRLPAEIRNQIYKYVLGGNVYYVESFWRPNNKLSVLWSCQQIYAEAKLLPYSCNTFSFPDYFLAYDNDNFPLRRTTAQKLAMSSVEFRLTVLCAGDGSVRMVPPGKSGYSKYFGMPSPFRNLNSIQVRIKVHSYDKSKNAEAVAREVQGIERACVNLTRGAEVSLEVSYMES